MRLKSKLKPPCGFVGVANPKTGPWPDAGMSSGAANMHAATQTRPILLLIILFSFSVLKTEKQQTSVWVARAHFVPTKTGRSRGLDKEERVQDLQLGWGDRKSTRLNSSHLGISYAVFC